MKKMIKKMALLTVAFALGLGALGQASFAICPQSDDVDVVDNPRAQEIFKGKNIGYFIRFTHTEGGGCDECIVERHGVATPCQ